MSAFVPSLKITDATLTIPIVITTVVAHEFVTDDNVTISDVEGNTAANNSWTITVLTSTTFSLNGSIGNGNYTANTGIVVYSGKIYAVEQFLNLVEVTTYRKMQGQLGNTLTLSQAVSLGLPALSVTVASNARPIKVTTNIAHGLISGNTVVISGVLGNTASNGLWLITVIDSTNFVLIGSVGNDDYVSGGSVVRLTNPSRVITDATNAVPIVITCLGHGLVNSPNVLVEISNIRGNTNANQQYSYTVIDLNHFSLDYSVGNGDFVANAAVSNAFNIITSILQNASNTTPILIKTQQNHGQITGKQVKIEGCLGNTAANGVWTITVQGVKTFTLDQSVGNAAYTGGGSFTSIEPRKTITNTTNASPIVITAPAHGFIDGDGVLVENVMGNDAANAAFIITLIDANTFSLNGSTGSGDYVNSSGDFRLIPNVPPLLVSNTEIEETVTTTGLGEIVFGTSVPTKSPFSVFANQAYVEYVITDGLNIETGLGAYNAKSDSLMRLLTYGDNNDLLDLPSGTKTVRGRQYLLGGPPPGSGSLGNTPPTPPVPPPVNSPPSISGILDIDALGGTNNIAPNAQVVSAAEEHALAVRQWALRTFDTRPETVRVRHHMRCIEIGRYRGLRCIRLEGNDIFIQYPGGNQTVMFLRGNQIYPEGYIASVIRNAEKAGATITRGDGLITIAVDEATGVATRVTLVPPGAITRLVNPLPQSMISGAINRPSRLLPRMKVAVGALIILQAGLIVVEIVNGSATQFQFMQGRLQFSDSIANSDFSRLGIGNRLYMMPIHCESPKYTKITVGYKDNPGYGFTPQVFLRDFPIHHVSGSVPLLDIGLPSNIPFTYTTGRLPNQSITRKNIPCDIFIVAPINTVDGTIGTGLENIEARTTTVGGDGTLRLFYLNWFSSSSRNNGMTGDAQIGHELVDASETSLPYVNFTSRYFRGKFLKARLPANGGFINPGSTGLDATDCLYLYVGTLIPFADGLGMCVRNGRTLWNMFNRLSYSDIQINNRDFYPANDIWARDILRAEEIDVMNGVHAFHYVDPTDGSNGLPSVRPFGGRFSCSLIGPVNLQIVHCGNTENNIGLLRMTNEAQATLNGTVDCVPINVEWENLHINPNDSAVPGLNSVKAMIRPLSEVLASHSFGVVGSVDSFEYEQNSGWSDDGLTAPPSCLNKTRRFGMSGDC